jgi:hypothetical protein
MSTEESKELVRRLVEEVVHRRDLDEIYVFTVADGTLVAARGVEDNLARLRQLGIGLDAGRR